MLEAQRAIHQHQMLEYVFQLNRLGDVEGTTVMERACSYMSAQTGFCVQAHDTVKDLEPYLREAAERLTTRHEELRVSHAEAERERDDLQRSVWMPSVAADGCMEGYLMKRGHNTFRTWNWRFCALDAEKGCILYFVDKAFGPKILIPDIRICTVKSECSENVDRRFVFEIVTPTKSYVLQAASEAQKQSWVRAITSAISRALNQSAHDKPIIRAHR
eukprot:UC1_evm1s937